MSYKADALRKRLGKALTRVKEIEGLILEAEREEREADQRVRKGLPRKNVQIWQRARSGWRGEISRS